MTPNRAAYRQHADTIRERIRSGTYAPGSRLPTDDDLAAELGTNRGTLAQAMTLLATEGLVIRAKGAGTTVNKIIGKILRAVPDRYEATFRERGKGAFDVEVTEQGHNPRWETSVTEAPAPERFADLLGTGECTIRTRRMYADDVAVQFAVTYAPGDVSSAAGITTADTGTGGMISRMAAAGHTQAEMVEEIDVRSPTEDEAAFLGLTEDHRVYEVLHTATTADGRTVEITQHVMPTHLWRLRYRWTPDAS